MNLYENKGIGILNEPPLKLKERTKILERRDHELIIGYLSEAPEELEMNEEASISNNWRTKPNEKGEKS